MQLRRAAFYAGDRGRTGTGITTHGILSPGRLPIPPLRPEYPYVSVWFLGDLNPGPTGYEPVALTN